MGNEIAIRPARPEDLEDVTTVLAASYETLWRGHYDDAELDALLPVVTRANPGLLASGRYFLAIDDAVPAGCGGWSPEFPGGEGRVEPGLGHIRHFGVHPDHLRKGIARRIHEACLAQALAEGITRMEAWSSFPAVEFYESLGYRVIGPISAKMPEPLPPLRSIRMQHDIA